MNEKPILYIHGFGTEYVPDKNNPGQMKPRDWVEYAPLGSVQKTMIREWIELINCPMPMTGRGDNNPAVSIATLRWEAIRPRYEAWKAGQELPIDGTPLAAWHGIQRQLADILKTHGIRTVEELAQLTDVHKQSLKIMGLGDYIENAKRFLAASDKTTVAASMEKKDKEIADLKEQMSEMMEMLKEQRAAAVPAALNAPASRRGRPPKSPQPPQAAV
jgi:hypothetical protein